MNDLKDSLIKIENLGLIRNRKPLLKNIDWEITEGQNWAIVGPNGCGKTLLMQVVQGRLPYSEGRITFKNSELKAGISGISFEMHQQMMANEDRLAYSRDFACGGRGIDCHRDARGCKEFFGIRCGSR